MKPHHIRLVMRSSPALPLNALIRLVAGRNASVPNLPWLEKHLLRTASNAV
jgi:hypothetical protein